MVKVASTMNWSIRGKMGAFFFFLRIHTSFHQAPVQRVYTREEEGEVNARL